VRVFNRLVYPPAGDGSGDSSALILASDVVGLPRLWKDLRTWRAEPRRASRRTVNVRRQAVEMLRQWK
jgi:hypothetical protein